MDKVKTVRLYGKLGSEFGRVHHLAVKSAAEAVRALCAMYEGFEKRMLEYNGGFAVFYGKDNLKQEDLRNPSGSEDIRIAPIPAGAKNGGLFSVIVGIVLIGVGAWTGQPAIIGAGAAMLIGGAMMMLAPTPKGMDDMDGVENRSSYSFNGAVNSVAQGNPVPLLYGELIAGSVVISGGIYSEG